MTPQPDIKMIRVRGRHNTPNTGNLDLHIQGAKFRLGKATCTIVFEENHYQVNHYQVRGLKNILATFDFPEEFRGIKGSTDELEVTVTNPGVGGGDPESHTVEVDVDIPDPLGFE